MQGHSNDPASDFKVFNCINFTRSDPCMKLDVYSFELIKLSLGGWSLMLLKNNHMVGGFVDSDFEDLKAAGDNWLKTHSQEPTE